MSKLIQNKDESSGDFQVGAVKHYIIQSCNGTKFISVECPICGIVVEGPALIEKGNVHFLDAWPARAHEMAEIAARWQKILTGKAEVPIEKLHIHLQIVDLNLHPDWLESSPYGLVQYFRLGELVDTPKELVEGKYDAALIHLFPDPDIPMEELERVVCHEMVHIAFPSCGGSRIVYSTVDEFFNDSVALKWVERKTKQLLRKYGNMTSVDSKRLDRRSKCSTGHTQQEQHWKDGKKQSETSETKHARKK